MILFESPRLIVERFTLVFDGFCKTLIFKFIKKQNGLSHVSAISAAKRLSPYQLNYKFTTSCASAMTHGMVAMDKREVIPTPCAEKRGEMS